MTDNKKPSADQTSTGPEQRREDRTAALQIAKEHPEAVQIAEAALIRKWGAEAGEKFANEIFRVSPGMLLEVEKRLTEINAEMPKNIKNERVQHNWNRIKMRFTEFVFIRAFFAHIINHLKGIEETPENFYTAYYEILPYIEKEMQKAPDGYYMLREMDIYDGLELPEVTKLWETGEPSGTQSQLLINAIRAAEVDAKAKSDIDEINLKESKWAPLYQGALTNDLMRLSIRDFFIETTGTTAYYTAPDGRKYSIDQFDQLTGTLTTSTKKLLDTAVFYLSAQNIYGSGRNSIKPQVKIPLRAYLEKNGHDVTPRPMATEEERAKENERVKARLKQFKTGIRRDLNDLRLIKWTGEEKRGRNAGDYAELQIISGHRIVKDYIYVNFDIDAARYLVNAHTMFFPLCLLLHDNKKSNPYPIGRKIALHNSIDHNFFAGTDCTLSVMALLNAAPEIPTIEELQERGQRNWKEKIKKPLETALDENIKVGLLKKWEYRQPKTGNTYTAEEARALSWEIYTTLVVDWVMAVRPPGQEERRAKIAAEKAAAEAAGKITQKKRGRPRKKPQNTKKGI